MAITDIGFAVINPQQPNSNVNQPTNFFAAYATVGQTPAIPGVAAFSDQFTKTDQVVSLKDSQTFDSLTVDTITSNGDEITFGKNIDANGHTITGSVFDADTLYVNTITSNNSEISISKDVDLGENSISANYITINTITSDSNEINVQKNLNLGSYGVIASGFRGKLNGNVEVYSGTSIFNEIQANSFIGPVTGNITGNVTGNLTGDASGTNLQYTNGSITNLSVQHLELQSGTNVEFESALVENAIVVTNSNAQSTFGNTGFITMFPENEWGYDEDEQLLYNSIAVAVLDHDTETVSLGHGIYDNGVFTFQPGQAQSIATRSSNITNGNLLKWDNEHHTIVDAGVAITAADKTAWNNKVDKTSYSSRIYGTDSTGAQALYTIGFNSAEITRYQGSSSGTSQPEGYLVSHMPVNPYQVAPKKYVDANLPVIRDWTV